MKWLEDKLKSICKTGDFTLTSGKKSDFYIDVKSLMFDAKALSAIGHVMYSSLLARWGEEAHAVGGLELGSVPISSAIAIRSYSLGVLTPVNQFVIRKNIRTHGTGKQIEGFEYVEGLNVIIVDDVLTTGGSILQAYEALKDSCNVLGALVVVDRQEEDKVNLPIEVASLYTKKDLLT